MTVDLGRDRLIVVAPGQALEGSESKGIHLVVVTICPVFGVRLVLERPAKSIIIVLLQTPELYSYAITAWTVS